MCINKKKMKLVTIVITRNNSCHVRTLHTLLKLNLICMQNGFQQEIAFCKDDPFDKNTLILSKIKDCDRILFIDYAIQPDELSVFKLLDKFEGYNCLVCPCVREGVNWEQFKQKVSSGTSEPKEQLALDFDTEVGQKIKDDIYKVENTNPRCWAIDSKSIVKHMRNKKKNLILPVKNDEMFENFKVKGIKIAAYINSNILTIFQHECLGNILNASGVSQV